MTGSSDTERWAASGCAALTGRADGPPLGPPVGFVDALDEVAAALRRRSARLGRPVAIDPLALLAERAAIAGLTRAGTTSCGGATRLLATADGWCALSLPRPDDVELLPAWLGIDPTGDPWSVVADTMGGRAIDEVVPAGAELGLAVAGLGEATTGPEAPRRLGPGDAVTELAGVVVADLSSLWAGPLCASLLADAGARVIKVESSRRPDGARRGPTRFHDLLNAGKRSVSLDFTTSDGRRQLADLLARVDVVIEGSRPRALAQLGIDAEHLLQHERPSVWLSITAHGRTGTAAHRIGFGDDAAVAGGLVAREDGEPRFLVDAVADPLTGMHGAATILDLVATEGSWLVDLAMGRIAAGVAGPMTPLPDGTAVTAPVAHRDRGSAAELGADTTDVLAGGRARR